MDDETVWKEMQTLQRDEQRRYTVLLGAMQPEGQGVFGKHGGGRLMQHGTQTLTCW